MTTSLAVPLLGILCILVQDILWCVQLEQAYDTYYLTQTFTYLGIVLFGILVIVDHMESGSSILVSPRLTTIHRQAYNRI